MPDDKSKLAFLSKFDEAFDSPTHSDLAVVVDSTRFNVHKVILGLRTSFFTNATRHGFSEANDNVVTIREHSVEVVRSFLKYCYTGDYEGKDISHVQVHALADMLDVPNLKLIATEKLKSQLEDHWVAVNFTDIVKDVYSVTNTRDEGIRNLLVTSAEKHIDELRMLQEFEDVLYEIGEFSGALVMSSLNTGPSTSNPMHYCCGRMCATYCVSCGIWKQGYY
ncbi:POZ domain-containing protein [Wilcoxina mikolae CBS 423.85]|nr:POZ domain-containing protein [Wilcoxina mikolae CBS 423.85]